jgi:hypothetical protein
MKPFDRDSNSRCRMRLAQIALAAFALFLAATAANAGVPIRLSVKFMNDTNGNFPVSGAINNEADLRAQVDETNRIFRGNGSEFEVEIIEIVELDEDNQFIMGFQIDHDGDPSTPRELEPLANVRERIRNAAQADEERFAWRTDAVNVYIIQNGSGVADFPPDNDIFLVGQGARFTTTGHEVGHIVDLLHTHEPSTSSNDRCGDTLEDDDEWDSIDEISNNAYGEIYDDLNDPVKENAVENVWFNLMSYYPTTRDRLTPCQLDRGSDGAYRTRDQILDANVHYVDANNTSSPHLGSWEAPYRTLSQVNASPTGEDAYWVLLSGAHTFTGTLDTPVAEIVTRRGASTIREDSPRWREEPNLDQSHNPAILEGITQVRAADRAGDPKAAVDALRTMAANTAGDERIVIELEIAQRLGHLGRSGEAIALYQAIHEHTEDPYLRAETESQIRHIERQAERRERSQPDASGEEIPEPGRTDDPAAPNDGPRNDDDSTRGAQPNTSIESPHRFDLARFAARGAEPEAAAPGLDGPNPSERARAVETAHPSLEPDPAPDSGTRNARGPSGTMSVVSGALALVGAALIFRSLRRRR